ncbi:BrnT family toxin [Cupriavidus necator]|uniref:BrnT family toxin n=1 Tax=Cupriavidus necator TaxID=106590 RepID=UPI0035317A01
MAARFHWPSLLAGVDDRADYRELREIGFGVIDERLYCVVFTQGGNAMHIISLRKANKREARNYVDQA